MKLFDDNLRTDPTPRRDGEALFPFLNRVCGPRWEILRDLLQTWFADYGYVDRARLARDIRTPDSRKFFSAFWELCLHEYFRRLAFSLTPHPPIGGSTRRPDFLLRKPAGAAFLEATVVHPTADELSFERRMAPIYEAINKLRSPDFSLNVEVLQVGTATPPGGRLRQKLTAWLASLDPDNCLPPASDPSFWDLPRYEWAWRDWRFEFRAIPIHADRRGRPGHRPVGWYPARGGPVDDHLAVRDALFTKARRYGTLGRPYILAVLVDRMTANEHELLQAMFGALWSNPTVLQSARLPPHYPDDYQGLWLAKKGPQYRDVSAVITATGLAPWTVASSELHLYHNPWASIPLAVALPFATTRLDAARGQLVTSPPSAAPWEILGLDEDWPGGPWWPLD